MSIDENKDNAPYPGLRPYREDEKAKFFGRDVDAEILIDKVLTNRLTLLFAASGVGKSSLLQAAVIPHLKSKTGENLTVVYHTDWVSDPVRSVRDAVLQALRTESLLPEHSEEAEFGEKLPDLLAFCEVFVRPPLVLILDQFEEFFRYQRHQTSFRELIDQLTTIITDKSLPVHLILSMREDFALELNAFKPKLPTILFENFYRLEKLGRQAVRDAIVIPAEQRGFTYEPELLKQLLADLLSREMDRQPNSPVVELLETVEPPYMQIVCARLWELNEGDSEKVLWLASYEKAGRAKGILKNYLDGVLQRFSFAEKQLASAAFDHLVSLRGVKMAYTAKGLAETVRVDEGELAKVLKRLESVRVLREIPRQDELWYELYHDMFSGSIEDWNNAWKDRMRRRRAAKVAGGVVFGIGVIFAGWDYYTNISNYHFRLSPKQSSDQVELWRGKPGSWDLFSVQKYQSDTGVKRHQLEPDKQFHQKLIADYDDLQMELVGNRPIDERVIAYAERGDFEAALGLAEKCLAPENIELASRILPSLAEIRVTGGVRIIYSSLKTSPSDTLKKKIAGEISRYTTTDTVMGSIERRVGLHGGIGNPAIGIALLSEHGNIFNKDNRNIYESIFLARHFLMQSSRIFEHDELTSFLLDENINEFFIENILTTIAESSQAIFYLLQLINDSNQAIRESTISALGRLSSSEIINSALDNFKDENHNIRSTSAKYLGELGSDKAIDGLLGLLKDQNIGVRSAAAGALGSLHSEKSIPELASVILKDKSEKVKGTAVESIRRLKAEELIPLLLSLVKRDDMYISSDFYNRQINLMKYNNNNSNFINQVLKTLVQMDISSYTSEVLSAAYSENPRVRASAAILLLYTRSKRSHSTLLELANDNDASVRNSAILTLGRIQSKDIFAILVNALNDENSSVRNSAILGLGRIDSKASTMVLLGRLNDADPTVQQTVVNTLIKTKHKSAFSVLLSALNEDDYYIRSIAASALRSYPSQESVSGLLSKIDDENKDVRAAALISLGKLGVKKITPMLLKITEYEDEWIKSEAILALGSLRNLEAIPALENIIKYNASENIRAAAMKGLKNIIGQEVIPVLIDSLGNGGGKNLNHSSMSITQKKRAIVNLSVIALANHKREHLIPYLFPLKEYERSKISNIEASARLASGELLDSVLRKTKNGNPQISRIGQAAALRMLKNNNLNKPQKRLLQKALNQVDQEALSTAKKLLAVEDKKEAEEKAKIANNPVNQPGLEEAPLTLAELKKELAHMDQAYADWRSSRDAEPPKATTDKNPTNETAKDNLTDPAPFIYEYAYAIAHESESEGIKLLGHNFYKVREAAARGLANSDALGVELLKKLEKAWLETKNPIERQGIYHAIDIALLAIEGVGYKKELADLKTYEPTLTNERSAASIKPRVEWTRIQLQWRVDANKELEELAARQLPKLLKEYCLNEDGTDMKPEECTLEN